MSRRRHDKIELSFDGLTDVVTNLAGALILLVVLVLSVTRLAQAPGGAPPATSPGKKPIAPVIEEIYHLEQEIAAVHQQILQIEESLPELRKRVQTLEQGDGPGSPVERPDQTACLVADRGSRRGGDPSAAVSGALHGGIQP